MSKNKARQASSEIYVCFSDSGSDPTYDSSLGTRLIVPFEGWHNGEDNHNPCVDDNIVFSAPCVPKTKDEIYQFADVIGWNVGYDNDGQLILYTGVLKE